jgi:hypothetical protein
MIVPADRPGLAQAGPSALLIRGAVLMVARFMWPAARRERAAVIQDPGQVPQLDPRVMPLRLQLVITRPGQVFSSANTTSPAVPVPLLPVPPVPVPPVPVPPVPARAAMFSRKVPGTGGSCAPPRGGGRPQPWATGLWSGPVMVRHQVVRGSRAAVGERATAATRTTRPPPHNTTNHSPDRPARPGTAPRAVRQVPGRW